MQSNIQLVHCKKSPYDIYIGRPSIFGNPYEIGKDGTRKEVISKYRKYVLDNPSLLEEIYKLKGKILGCWCYPLPCHGQVILEIIDNPPIDNFFN